MNRELLGLQKYLIMSIFADEVSLRLNVSKQIFYKPKKLTDMKKTLLLSMLGLMTAGTMSAQVYITDMKFNPNGVTNEGLVVGSFGEDMPFVLWDAKSGTGATSMKAIGGQSMGQEGAGGVARFSHDGKFVAAPTWIDDIPVSTNWEKKEYPDFAFTYKDIAYASDFVLLAVGAAEDGQSGVILKSSNNGDTWRNTEYNEGSEVLSLPTTGIVSIAPQSYQHILAGGMNGKLYLSTSAGTGWELVDVQPEGDESVVDTYWAMDFMYAGPSAPISDYGVIGVELEGGTGAVWYTENQGESFLIATGVNGVPSYITHLSGTFFMTTFNGHIQKSEDYGKTWTDVFTTDGAPLYRMKFADEKKGIAMSDNVVYITRDGGSTWTRQDVIQAGINPLANGNAVKWNDATWNGNTIMLAGNGGMFYTSTDDGETFSSVTPDSEYDGDYTLLYYARDAYSLFGQQGLFYHKKEVGTVSAYGAGIYDIENDTWTMLPSFGQVSDRNVASPWHFSGDGQTVVGDVKAYSPVTGKVVTHAAVMTRDGITDLGSKFDDITEEPLAGRPTQAKGVSYDGSVVVGFQDTWGPRYGCIWTRNADGSYTQKIMKKDMSMSDDEIDYANKEQCMSNLVYMARSVSPDGKWIGGDGNSWAVFKSPWLWNKEEGYVFPFGEDSEVGGSVAAITADGEKAVGWQGIGSSAWLYEKGKGVTYLQDYATEVLGYDFGDFAIASVYDISPNGRYVTGYGLRGVNDMYGYMIDLEAGTTSIESKTVDQVKASVYPNPVADELHIDMPFDSGDVVTKLTLVDMQGRVVRRIDTAHQSNTMDVANLSEGIYVLDVNARGTHKSFKIMVKH